MSEPKDVFKVLKMYLPTRHYPDYNFVGLIIGPRGATVRTLEFESGAKVAIRGKAHPGAGEEPLHVQIRGRDDECLDRAVSKLQQLLEGIDPEKLDISREQWDTSSDSSRNRSASDASENRPGEGQK